jgi:alpha-galactosidase
MAQSPTLRDAEVALVDADPWKCEQMGRFCERINRDNDGNLKIRYTTDRREALPKSDYVVLSFAVGNYHYRETGTNLALNYGIKLVSGETAGPSMVFRTIRAVPGVLEAAKDIEALCPNALTINYVNPTNIIGTALDRFTKLRWYAFCDGNYEAVLRRLALFLGIKDLKDAEERLTWKLGGLNHFTFITRVWDRGQDVWEQFKRGLEESAKAGGINGIKQAEWEMTEIFDAFPTQITHPIEYLRYFQGKGAKPERDYHVKKWNLNQRIGWYKRVWREIEECNAKDLSTETMFTDSTDMVAVVLESIEADRHKSLCVNVRNDGRIANLPAETVVELYGTFGREGADVPAFGPLPRGILGLTQQIIDEQELALEAAMTGNFQTAVRAIAADPLVMSLNDAKDLAHALIAVEEAHLDAKWAGYWRARYPSGGHNA